MMLFKIDLVELILFNAEVKMTKKIMTNDQIPMTKQLPNLNAQMFKTIN